MNYWVVGKHVTAGHRACRLFFYATNQEKVYKSAKNSRRRTLRAYRLFRCATINVYSGLLARQSSNKFESTLATLRHCHPKNELYSPAETEESPIPSVFPPLS